VVDPSVVDVVLTSCLINGSLVKEVVASLVILITSTSRFLISSSLVLIVVPEVSS
jgi:hypothetical protein